MLQKKSLHLRRSAIGISGRFLIHYCLLLLSLNIYIRGQNSGLLPSLGWKKIDRHSIRNHLIAELSKNDHAIQSKMWQVTPEEWRSDFIHL